MSYCITIGDFQSEIKAYYKRTGLRLQFPEIMQYLYRHNLFKSHIDFPAIPTIINSMSDAEFDILMNAIPLIFDDFEHFPAINVTENDMISKNRDVFAIRHMSYTRPCAHKHNYYEMNIVLNGSAVFYFENEVRTLRQGEICIVAPFSDHDICIEDDTSRVCSISIRQSTFNSTFFSLLSNQDLLAHFFRKTLQDNNRANYLLFFVKDMTRVNLYFRQLFIESNIMDKYSNNCCINFVHLICAEILRNYSASIQFYNYGIGSDISLLLQYIQHNYKTVTLSALCEIFHYSEPHLCAHIKNHTGYTFSELLRQVRLHHAVNYLLNTNMKIAEIAEAVGYNSADHFSRVFRGKYDMSPQQYRKQNLSQHPDAGELSSIPFKT